MIRKISFIDALTVCLDIYIPRLCIFAIILIYVLFGNDISVEQVYLVTAFYTLLRVSVNICMTLGKTELYLFFLIIVYVDLKKTPAMDPLQIDLCVCKLYNNIF